MKPHSRRLRLPFFLGFTSCPSAALSAPDLEGIWEGGTITRGVSSTMYSLISDDFRRRRKALRALPWSRGV